MLLCIVKYEQLGPTVHMIHTSHQVPIQLHSLCAYPIVARVLIKLFRPRLGQLESFRPRLGQLESFRPRLGRLESFRPRLGR